MKAGLDLTHDLAQTIAVVALGRVSLHRSEPSLQRFDETQ